MTVTVIVGAQWGDEGKGRVIDYLAARANMVVRFQGGDNAGHTVVNDYGRHALHLIPSGIFYPQVYNLLGAGTLVNFDRIGEELANLEAAGVDVSNMHIDLRAHVIWPFHMLLDGASEDRAVARTQAADDEAEGTDKAPSGAAKGGALGTTRRGIGPAYGEKHSYRGIRVADLLRPDMLRERLTAVLPRVNHLLAYYGLAQFAVDDLMDQGAAWRARYSEMIVDSVPLLRRTVEGGGNVLLEGQLGVLRGVNWGIYPYSTGSSPTAGGACVGAGIPPRAIDKVLGVVKAYSTSVGGGPFPTELFDDNGARLQEVGSEFGATTGRPRRCGWFDGVAIRYATWINGFTSIAVTKLDVLDGFESIQLCTGYRHRESGQMLDHVPDTATQYEVDPVYETWPGWRSDTSGCRAWDDLPAEARAYLRRIEELAGAPMRFVSVGPERSQMIVM